MTKKNIVLSLLLLIVVIFSGCSAQESGQSAGDQAVLPVPDQAGVQSEDSLAVLKEKLAVKYQGILPREWGYVRDVKVRLNTNDKVTALTLDACGGSSLSNGYDQELLEYLKAESIPATLFISGLWIEANPELVLSLSQNPLFTVENHGTRHRPLSVSGQQAYKIVGTGSVAEVVDEVELNARRIRDITGRKPRFYRSGTAYYDDVAVKLVAELGYQAVNFNVIGDAGATYTKVQVAQALSQAKPGSIIILHMNHPEAQTAEGLKEGVRSLRAAGFRFVRLDEYELLSDQK